MSEVALYRKWSAVLREQFGERIQKVSLDIGAGCPHRDGLARGGCIFCDSKGGGSGAWLESKSMEEQIETGIDIAERRYKAGKVILYFQSYSATNLPLDVLEKRVRDAIAIAGERIEVAGVALGTRPDIVPEDFLDLLERLREEGLQIWLELGIQTIDESGLEWLNRGHGFDEIADAIDRVNRREILICAHLISGISGEDKSQLSTSALWLTKRGVHALKFHPLHVLRGTVLEQMYINNEYVPLTLDDYAKRVAESLSLLPRETIIQRLTADARPPSLISPMWITEKNHVISKIEGYLNMINGY